LVKIIEQKKTNKRIIVKIKKSKKDKATMNGYIKDIEKETLDNTNFRKVVYTGKHSQLVLMCLKPGEEIGNEVHEDVDQFFRFEQGKGKVVLNNKDEYPVTADYAAVVPAGTWHNVINAGENDLKLYTVYSPPEHKEGTVHPTKADAKEEHFDGTTTE
jgi:mannose-6-phosphate isomerase-like protein (cupin superfamily)